MARDPHFHSLQYLWANRRHSHKLDQIKHLVVATTSSLARRKKKHFFPPGWPCHSLASPRTKAGAKPRGCFPREDFLSLFFRYSPQRRERRISFARAWRARPVKNQTHANPRCSRQTPLSDWTTRFPIQTVLPCLRARARGEPLALLPGDQ